MTTSCPAFAAVTPPSSPRHDITVASARQSALKYLVPADGLASAILEILRDPPDEIALQLVLVR